MGWSCGVNERSCRERRGRAWAIFSNCRRRVRWLIGTTRNPTRIARNPTRIARNPTRIARNPKHIARNPRCNSTHVTPTTTQPQHKYNPYCTPHSINTTHTHKHRFKCRPASEIK
ncbi:hypothetical protein Pcinc_034340 [Petrolisthes cinctipes]|uniref:Uncharacterized protein n=1 Tax=Petrolisthes cinctipes TaxID=88211 RepID=A0AAE1JXI7_PETCI|nr:hypothetical protein Pcinc_034340 [Petrolisthes cinctipes]